MDAKYKFIKNENEIIEKINTLDKSAKVYVSKISDLYYEDIYFMTMIDKSIKLIDTFLYALERRNVTILAALTRVQMDCALRAYATTLVADSGEFCKAVLFEDIQINKIKDLNNEKLTDRHLCETLGNCLKLPVYDLYRKVSGFIHFSSSSFQNIAKCDDGCSFSMYISRNNRIENKEIYEGLSIELANHFYYFGRILIEVIFSSWLEQKTDFEK